MAASYCARLTGSLAITFRSHLGDVGFHSKLTTYNSQLVSFPMAKNAAKPVSAFEIGCPCCGAVLKVDAATRAVIAHTAPVRPKTFADLEEAARAMKEQDSRKESLFQQSVQAQKNSADLLEKKFQEAVKRAKETPDKPRIRDFDLD
jgi:hypothetical protein